MTHSREDHTYKYYWIQFPSNSSTHAANLTVRSRYTKACGWGVRLLVWVRLHAVCAAALPLRECRSLREGLSSRFHCGGSGSDQRVVLHSDGHLYVSLQQTRWVVLCQGSTVQCSAVQWERRVLLIVFIRISYCPMLVIFIDFNTVHLFWWLCSIPFYSLCSAYPVCLITPQPELRKPSIPYHRHHQDLIFFFPSFLFLRALSYPPFFLTSLTHTFHPFLLFNLLLSLRYLSPFPSAFKSLIVNGLVLASDGKKMSKRLSNYPDPGIVLKKYGAGNALRKLWWWFHVSPCRVITCRVCVWLH